MTKEKDCTDTGSFLNTAAHWLVEQVDLEPADPQSLPASSLPGILMGTVGPRCLSFYAMDGKSLIR